MHHVGIRDAIAAVEPDLIELRHDLHAHPEVSWNEVRTTDVLASWMDKSDITHRRFTESESGGTGLVAEVGAEGRPVVALRADIDALPVDDLTDDDWRSTSPGISHACGHDVHSAALAGAAVALAELERREPLPVRVRLIFQPAEEAMPGGAVRLIKAGILDDVTRIFALHCDPTLDVGQVGLREGAITGASDHVSVRLSGRGGHTSRPHLTQDVTFAAGHLLTDLPAVLSRRLDPRVGASMVWGRVWAGDAANVIPAHAELDGTLRMLDADTWHEAEGLVREIIADVMRPYGVDVEVRYVRGVPPVVNEFACTQALREAATVTVGDQGIAVSQQSLGGEDFGWYSAAVPGAMARLGTRFPGGPTFDLHQGTYRVDDRAVAIGAAVLSNVSLAS